MLNKKELGIILIVTLILSFVISLVETLEIFLYTLLMIFSIILVNVFTKKITAGPLELRGNLAISINLLYHCWTNSGLCLRRRRPKAQAMPIAVY